MTTSLTERQIYDYCYRSINTVCAQSTNVTDEPTDILFIRKQFIHTQATVAAKQAYILRSGSGKMLQSLFISFKAQQAHLNQYTVLYVVLNCKISRHLPSAVRSMFMLSYIVSPSCRPILVPSVVLSMGLSGRIKTNAQQSSVTRSLLCCLLNRSWKAHRHFSVCSNRRRESVQQDACRSRRPRCQTSRGLQGWLPVANLRCLSAYTDSFLCVQCCDYVPFLRCKCTACMVIEPMHSMQVPSAGNFPMSDVDLCECESVNWRYLNHAFCSAW